MSFLSGLVDIVETFVSMKLSIKFIEEFVEAKISSISTSPEREDTILIEDPFKT